MVPEIGQMTGVRRIEAGIRYTAASRGGTWYLPSLDLSPVNVVGWISFTWLARAPN